MIVGKKPHIANGDSQSNMELQRLNFCESRDG